MPDLATQDSAAQTPFDAGIDPLTGLHRMSRTAGAGTQEYVAVNIPSIISIFFGLISFLCLFSSLLLAIPAVAAVLAIFGIRQVRGSNGTQTGAGFAWLALFFAVGFAGFRAVHEGMEARQARADERQIVELIGRVSNAIYTEKYADAYALFTDKFRARISAEQFAVLWTSLRNNEYYGPSKMSSNGVMSFDELVDGTRVAAGMIIVKGDRSDQPDRPTMTFRREADGRWGVEDIPQYFPTAPPAAQTGQPSGAGSAPGRG